MQVIWLLALLFLSACGSESDTVSRSQLAAGKTPKNSTFKEKGEASPLDVFSFLTGSKKLKTYRRFGALFSGDGLTSDVENVKGCYLLVDPKEDWYGDFSFVRVTVGHSPAWRSTFDIDDEFAQHCRLRSYVDEKTGELLGVLNCWDGKGVDAWSFTLNRNEKAVAYENFGKIYDERAKCLNLADEQPH